MSLDSKMGRHKLRRSIDDPRRRKDRVGAQGQLSELLELGRDLFAKQRLESRCQVEDLGMSVLLCQCAEVEDLRGSEGGGLVDGEVSDVFGVAGHAL